MNKEPRLKYSGITSTLVGDLEKLTPFNNALGIIQNGVDNFYPNRVEAIINKSVTSKTCARLMASYLTGRGDIANNKKIVGGNGYNLLKLISSISKSITNHRGVFVLVSYNANFKPSEYKVLPFKSCRLGKKDDNEFNGKIGYCKEWLRANEDDITFFNVFNPSNAEREIQESRGNNLAEKVSTYKGQIFYYNLDEEYDYPLSTIDAVIRDCDSERRASVYKNQSLRKGFFGKQVVITKPLVGDAEDYDEIEKYYQAQNDRQNFKDTLQDFIGAENNGGVIHFEYDLLDGENIDNVLKFQKIDSDIDDKMFEHTESSVFKNILMAFNSVPPALVRPENSVFSASGDSINAMKEVYQNNTQDERNVVEHIASYLMMNFYEPLQEVKIEPLIKLNIQRDDAINR